jgi:hypothetical protein
MSSKYTGSPLGLIDDGGVSTYNQTGNIESIFSAYSKKGQKQTLKRSSGINNSGILSGTPHSDDIYNISTSNIIEKLSGIQHMRLTYADFAYTKDLGVYPNNRLAIVRKFKSPVVDDLYNVSSGPGEPISTLVTWVDPGKDFISIKFNEEWTTSATSFTEILNEVGKDFRLSGLGDQAAKGFDGVTLPGATQEQQRKLLVAVGLIAENDNSELPIGDPNLIKSAQVRKLSKDTEFAGLTGKFSITLNAKFEQKFINGNDPTLVYADIINTILNMGTQPATFYLGKQNDAGNTIKEFSDRLMKNPNAEVERIATALVNEVKAVIEKVVNALQNAVEAVKKDPINTVKEAVGDTVDKIVKSIISYIVKAYRIRIIGVVQALTGGPSTPWHVTIGNPLRPIFCSGDMLCTDITLKLGEQLSFNDLPTYIDATITLTSARDLGLQEIFAKLNSGGIRTTDGKEITDRTESFWSNVIITEGDSTTGITASNTQDSQADESEITQNNTNVQPITKVSETPNQIEDNPSIVVTSVPTILQVNADPLANEPVVEAGQSQESETLRTDETQAMTGSTEGSSEQIESPTPIQNSGVDSTTIENTNNNVDWKEGEVVYKSNVSFPLAGGMGSGNEWRVVIRKTGEVGTYKAEADVLLIIDGEVQGKSISEIGTDLESLKRNIDSRINDAEGVTTFRL